MRELSLTESNSITGGLKACLYANFKTSKIMHATNSIVVGGRVYYVGHNDYYMGFIAPRRVNPYQYGH